MAGGRIGGRSGRVWLTAPVRQVMRHMAMVCAALCLGLIGLAWAEPASAPAAMPAALVLGLWANLLSLLLLASRPRG